MPIASGLGRLLCLPMRPVVVFALYVWVAVSLVALIVQQIRRVMHRRARNRLVEPAAAETTADVVTTPAPDPEPVARTTIFERLAEAPAPVPAPVQQQNGPAKRPGARGLADTLAGIHLPCELLPVVPKGVSPSDTTVSLVTASAPPDVVGPAIADELERLGYELAAVSASRLIARREADVLTLDMIVSPSQLERDGIALYPEVSDNAVLVVIAMGEPTP